MCVAELDDGELSLENVGVEEDLLRVTVRPTSRQYETGKRIRSRLEGRGTHLVRDGLNLCGVDQDCKLCNAEVANADTPTAMSAQMSAHCAARGIVVEPTWQDRPSGAAPSSPMQWVYPASRGGDGGSNTSPHT